MDFKKSLALTLQFEGGYSNHPDDPGGSTQCGITQATYDSYRTRKGLLPRDVRKITQDEIQDCYQRGYWFASGASSCQDGPFATVLFDFAVNSGVSQALKSAQKLLGLTVDGVLGPKTVARLQETTQAEALQLLDTRMAFYRAIVARRPQSLQFLDGWTNRINILRKAIS